jgi:hypothetical protein
LKRTGRTPTAQARRIFYNGWMLSIATPEVEPGRFQARVVLTSMERGRTRSQIFLDLECFPNETLALQRAEQAAIQWVDNTG